MHAGDTGRGNGGGGVEESEVGGGEADTVLGGCLARNVTSGTDINKLRGGALHLGRTHSQAVGLGVNSG